LGGRTGSRLMGLIEKYRESIGRSFGAYNRAMTPDQAADQNKKSLSGQEQEFVQAWSDFKTNWGTTMLPYFSRILTIGSQLLRPSDEKTPWYIDLAKEVGHAINPLDFKSGLGKDLGYVGAAFTGAGHDTAGRGSRMLHAHINIDGKKFASAFVPYLTDPMTGSQIGPSGGDSLAYLPITGGSPF